MDMDVQQYINKQLQGSLIVDDSIKQIFGKNPIDIKLEHIGEILDDGGILDFKTYFDPRSMSYKYSVLYDDNHYYGMIAYETLKCAPEEYIVQEITQLIMVNLINPDPEWIYSNENEQAFLDAAHDYGWR